MTSNNSPERFHERYAHYATAVLERPAIVTSTYCLNYAQLFDRINSAAAYLSASGLRPGLAVGLTVADEAEHLIASLALFALGCAHITLATHDTESMRADLARRTGITHVVADISVTSANAIIIRWPAEVGRPAATTRAAIAPNEGRLFLRTSGTTGTTNIMAFKESQIALQADRHPEYADARLLSLATIEHNNVKRHRLYCAWNGGANVFQDHGAGDLAQFIMDHGVTRLDISRMHAEGLPHLRGADQLSHIAITTGGMAMPYPTRKALEESVTRHLFTRYGASEIGTIAIALPGEHDEDETSGHAASGTEIRIVDAFGTTLPVGETGRIAVRAPGMTDGYLDNPEQTARRFIDGWFYPGDIGCLRTDGHLIVQGREDEMIIMNGLNIFPQEIEAVLESHSDVAYSAALAFPSRIHGNVPVAAVQLRNSGAITGPELIRWAHGVLGIRAPKRIIIVDALPRNSQGKVTKRALLPLFERK